MYPWLAYSKECNGAFCINCVLFAGETTHNSSKLKNLYKNNPSWGVAPQRLRDHAIKSQVHQTATIRMTNFKLLMEQKSTSIDGQLESLRQKKIKENR